MVVYDLFSKRQKKLRGEIVEVYSYDSIPEPLRVQVVHILRSSLGDERSSYYSKNIQSAYETVFTILCKEYGVFHLVPEYLATDCMKQVICFILKEENTEKVVDVIELAFKLVNGLVRQYGYRELNNSDEIATNSIEELNYRFQEHAIGFQFEGGEIIRVDSAFIHKEVVLPTLKLLNDSMYQGAQDEFLKAHEHYRHDNHKEALNECLKSFESTIKAICEKRGWTYDKAKDTASKLIDLCFQKGLIPSFWQSQMSALRTLLESGVPTGRNKLSGHGQGRLPTTIPRHLVTYVLHMTASCIHFLAEAEKDLP